jgi:hypothetical protein
MPTTAEIIIRMREDHARQIAALRRQMQDLGRETKASMAQAKDSADLLKDMFGIHMPRELTKLLAQSKLIGPALAAAFSGVAALSFISILGQIPELFEKLKASVTGWDEAAKKSYENFLEYNRKAIEGLTEFEAKMAEVSGGKRAGLQVQLEAATADAVANQQAAVRARQGITALGQNQRGMFAWLGLETEGGKTLKELTADAERFQKQADEAVQRIRELNQQLAITGAEEGVKSLKKAKEEAEELADAIKRTNFELGLFMRKVEEQTAKGFFSPNVFDPSAIAAREAIAQGESFQQAIAGAQAMGKVRPTPFASFFSPDVFDPAGAQVRAGLAQQAELKRKSDEFFRDFRHGAGEVWDVFATRGTNVLTSLANLASGLLNSVGRALFTQFAAGLFTGQTGGAGGALGKVGGLGASIGLSSGLSGLFGGAAATAGAFTTVGGTSVLAGGALTAPALAPALLAGGGGAAAGGIGAALGLGGGAGLLGLGALTIPVVGGIVAGAIFGLSKLLGHRPEAPFTTDPNSAERNRSIFFFTSMAEAADRFSRAVDRFSTMPPGQVVVDGMPAALSSSNQFRRNVAAVLMDDDL